MSFPTLITGFGRHQISVSLTIVSAELVLDSTLTARESAPLTSHCNIRASSVVVQKPERSPLPLQKSDRALPATDVVVVDC